MQKHGRKIVYMGITVILLAGTITNTAAAFSFNNVFTRAMEFRLWIGKLLEQLVELKREEVSESEKEKEDAPASSLSVGVRDNDDVRRLQYFLIQEGYLKGGVTGNYLSLTKAAVRRFQAATGLPTTGIFDARTREVMDGLSKKRVGMVGKKDTEDGRTILARTEIPTSLSGAVISKTQPNSISAQNGYRIDPRPIYDMQMIERSVFDAVNNERQKNGLGILQWDERLADVARAHSNDQAMDNKKIVNADVACLYPYIRHEGFINGFRIGDRLDNKNIPYSMAGENLIILPVSKNLIYRATNGVSTCAVFSDIDAPAGETQESARARVHKSLLDRMSLMLDQPKLEWVNKEWREVSDMASESVNDWMKSPGHRHVILTAEFEESGIGGAMVNDHIILTQVFLKK